MQKELISRSLPSHIGKTLIPNRSHLRFWVVISFGVHNLIPDTEGAQRVTNMALVKCQRSTAPTQQCHLFPEQQRRDASSSLGGAENEGSPPPWV